MQPRDLVPIMLLEEKTVPKTIIAIWTGTHGVANVQVRKIFFAVF